MTLAILEPGHPQLVAVCRRHHVQRLAVFGSFVHGRFRPGESDVDVLVEFSNLPPARYAQAYFGLKEELEGLLGHPVDLVTAESVHNPYRREGIRNSERQLYAA